MRIGLICNGLGVTRRGAERFSLEFKKHMSDHFDIDLLGVKDTKTKTRNDFHLPWRNGRAYLESYYCCMFLYKHHWLEKYDILINNAGFPGAYWCSKNQERTNIPFITRARGGGLEEYLSRWYQPDCMVFLTDEHRERIAKDVVPGVTIPNGIDVNSYKNRKPVAFLTDSLEKPIFLSTSAFIGLKRNHLLIDAVAKLGFGTLVMAGDGDLYNKTCDYGRSKLGKRFVTTGVLDDNTIRDWYSSSDMFLNASTSEAFGVVYLESMASGLPVVTQRDNKRKEIIGEGGILTECSSIELFADAIQCALNKKWGNKPVEQAMNYDWSIIGKRWINIINEVLAR